MSPRSRVIAWITGLWLVIGGLLGASHEARAAHFLDDHGRAFHGSRMTGEHTASHSDIHGRDAAPDHDACTIVPALHHAATTTAAPHAIAHLTDHTHVARTYAAAAVSIALFRIAPKTSPPVKPLP